VSTVVLDSHLVHWWSAEPDRISATASRAITGADELAVADISWFELAWLARHERIVVAIPIAAWLQQLARQVRTVQVTPTIAATVVSLPSWFPGVPGDPADRLIYATAIENGWRLVTKDRRLRTHRHPRPVTIW
jgi:PIN domain nuclease of toxin-antitoxin system